MRTYACTHQHCTRKTPPLFKPANSEPFKLVTVQQVFQPAMEGSDLIGRAKTGSGKTLAFALPVVEGLISEDRAAGVGAAAPARRGRPPKSLLEGGMPPSSVPRGAYGRAPRCLILAPTRELANQVAKEFESVCPSLTVRSFYGGVSIVNQIRDLERGVDVVVGTPGRVIDLIERKKLPLSKVRGLGAPRRRVGSLHCCCTGG